MLPHVKLCVRDIHLQSSTPVKFQALLSAQQATCTCVLSSGTSAFACFPGALLKAAFVCAEIVQYPSSLSLEQQMKVRYGGGFELHTWSNLPHGSGLGTSSILAGAVMAAVWKASGRYFDIHSLNHAVSYCDIY